MKPQEEKEFNDMFSSLEPEQPSMRFTKNVMESIDDMPVAKVSKRYVNPWVVGGVVVMMIFTLLVSGAYVYTSSTAESNSQLSFFAEQTSRYFSLLAFVNVVLLLVFAERWLSSKNRIKYLERLNQL